MVLLYLNKGFDLVQICPITIQSIRVLLRFTDSDYLFGIFKHFSCCDVRYDFRINTMFGSSLPPVVCISVICVCLRIVVSNTYCVVFLFCLSSSFVLCTQCLLSSWHLDILILFRDILNTVYRLKLTSYKINKKYYCRKFHISTDKS